MRVTGQLIEITEDNSKGEHSREIQWAFRVLPTKHNSKYSTHLPGLQTQVLTSNPQQLSCCSASGRTMSNQFLPIQ
jgi:hypothetical protein